MVDRTRDAGTIADVQRRFPGPSSCRSARSIDLYQVADNRRVINWREAMIRPIVVALALCVVSSAQSMPYVPLQQPNSSVIPVRQGCGLGRQLVDGMCVSNTRLRAAVRKCSSRKMRMVNGRCEPRATCRRLWRGATCGPATCGHSRHAALIGARRLSKRDARAVRLRSPSRRRS